VRRYHRNRRSSSALHTVQAWPSVPTTSDRRPDHRRDMRTRARGTRREAGAVHGGSLRIHMNGAPPLGEDDAAHGEFGGAALRRQPAFLHRRGQGHVTAEGPVGRAVQAQGADHELRCVVAERLADGRRAGAGDHERGLVALGGRDGIDAGGCRCSTRLAGDRRSCQNKGRSELRD